MRNLIARSRTTMFLVLVTAAMGATSELAAQTLEGVDIENTATAAYTDANGNDYTDAVGSVTVTVGFTASLSVTAGATSAGPGAGSTDNTLTFTIDNSGNGTDQISVNVTNTNTDGAVITGYQIDGTGPIYANLTDLNAALALIDLDPLTGSVDITVIYDVPPGATPTDVAIIELTATSVRDGTESNSAQTTVTPGGVDVVADDDTAEELPSGSGPATYTVTYQVTNEGDATDIDLSAALDGTNAGLVTITAIGVPALTLTDPSGTLLDVYFGAGQTYEVEVTYTVGDAPLGANTTITLTATASDVAGMPSGSDDTVLTVQRPALTLTKSVHNSQTGAENDNDPLPGDPLPGNQIWYRIVVDNATGTATADLTQAGMGLEDDFSALPVAYVSSSLAALAGPGFAAWAGLAELSEVITGTVMIPAGDKAGFIFSVTID